MRQIIVLVFSIFLIASCSTKKDKETVTASSNIENTTLIQYKDISSKSKSQTFPIRIRIGTHLSSNCNGNHPCGPCPGICIQFGKPKKEPVPPKILLVDYENGDRIVWISKESDNQVKMIFTAPGHDDNGVVIFEENYSLGDSISMDLGFSGSVSIVPGNYILDYTNDTYGKGIFDVISD